MAKESNLFNDDLLPPVRSTFLTVLCVLTFLYSAYSIFKSVTSVINSKQVAEVVRRQNNPQNQKEQRKTLEGKNDKGTKFALKMMDSAEQMADENKIRMNAMLDIVANLLTLAGAFLMWRLNRTGFYLYIAGVALWVMAPLIAFGTGVFIAVMIAALCCFIGLLFVILYAMNLKDMKKPVAIAIT